MDSNKMFSGKKNLAILIIGAAVFLAIFFHHSEINWQFKGVATNVEYDEKGYPTVTVNGKEYDLFHTTWDHSFKITKGDTLIKKKGDLRLKLIWPNTHDTVFFDNNDPVIGKWHFKGRVENAWIKPGKKYIYFIVKGREYDLDGDSWKINAMVQKGDYIIKQKGKEHFEIIKPNAKDTLLIEKN